MTNNIIFLFKYVIHPIIFIIISNTIPVNTLHAQKYPYKEFKNRNEGIVKDIELIAGERLDLLSSTVENIEKRPGTNPQLYNLAFYLAESVSVDIDVKEIKKSYLMRPTQRQYSDGLNIFSWPAKIPSYYHINLDKLFPIAEIYDSEINTVVPLILYYKKPINKILLYKFCFRAQSPIEKLVYKIFKLSSHLLIYEKKLGNLDDFFFINWNGKNKENITQDNDWYYLSIRAEFESFPGSTYKPTVTLNYKFFHFKNIIQHIAKNK